MNRTEFRNHVLGGQVHLGSRVAVGITDAEVFTGVLCSAPDNEGFYVSLDNLEFDEFTVFSPLFTDQVPHSIVSVEYV